MSTKAVKSRLIDLLRWTRGEQQALWQGLSEAERAAKGTYEKWSAKDLLAHIAAWNEVVAEGLELCRRGETPPRSEGLEEANRQIFEAHCQKTWDEVMAYEERTFERLAAAVEALPEEVLLDPQRFEWTGGRAIWKRVAFTGCFHALDHVSKFLVGRGERERATQLQERMAEKIAALDEAPDWQGATLYNLACFYALSDQPDRALRVLPRALELSPELVDWSKGDADLDALRDLPQFRALYVD